MIWNYTWLPMADSGSPAPSSEGRTFFRHSLILGVADAVSMGLGFVTTILVTDLLGERFGLLLGAQRFVGFFLVIAQFGLTPFLIRSIAAKREDAGNLVGDVLLLRAVLGVLFSSVVVGSAALTRYMPEHLWLIAAWAGIEILGVLAETNSAACQGLEKMGLSSMIQLSRVVPNVIGVVLVVWMGRGLSELVTVYVLSRVIQLFVSLGVSFQILGAKNIRFEFSRIPPLLRASYRYLGIIVGYGIFRSVDVIILTLVAGTAEVARYGAGMNFLDVLFIFPLIAQKALLPMFGRLSGSTTVAGMGRNTLHVFSMLAFPAAVGLSVVARQVVALYPSGEFGSSAVVLSILAPAFVLTTFVSATVTILTGVGNITSIVRAYLVTFAFQIPLNLFLASHYGAVGTSVATVTAYLILAACLAPPSLGVIRSFPLTAMLRHGTCAAAMVLAVYPLRNSSLLVSISVGVVIYTLALFLLAPANGLERRILKFGLKKLGAILGRKTE
jgi:O-antigen/teichoic acid export membrane protein